MLARILPLTLLLLALHAPTVQANSYWANLGIGNGQPAIAMGTDGFSVTSHGGPWRTWGNHCEADAGTFVAGAYCRIKWTVPAGLTAGDASGGGIARGNFRTANAYFVLRSERPNGNPGNVVDSPGDGAFSHGFGALSTQFEIGLRVTQQTTTTAATNWFHINSFDVLLHDPSTPAIQYVSASGGAWKGPGCTPLTYAWADSGSQMWSTSLTNASTGASVDNWTNAPGRNVVQSGIPIATRSVCVPAQPTGTYTYRTAATDRSGNSSSNDFSLSFDATGPALTTAALDGAPLSQGATVSSYRPAIAWSASDAHSGVGTVAVSMDGTQVQFRRDGETIVLTPPVDLPLGEHVFTLSVTDVVGNEATTSTRVRIADTVAPVISVQQPGISGGNNPVLDLFASDDRSGIAPATWSVTVNGQPLVLDTSGARLQAELGYLVNGTHSIEARISDNAGNIGRAVITYTARGVDGAAPLPGITGLYVLEAPEKVTEGTATRIRAAAVKNGRPLAGMRAELHQGTATVAGKPISADGTVDIAVTLKDGAPLTLTVNGSSLEDQVIEFTFVPLPKPAAAASGPPAAGATAATRVPPTIVDRVIDGDTIRLRDGRTVRLLQIDAPETNECFGRRATAELHKLLKPGARVTLTTDAKLERTDSYGRLLRYVAVGRTQVNRTLVLRGAAAPYFYKGARGRYASKLLSDATTARRAKRGLWSACPSVRLTPNRGTNTGPT